MSMQTIEVEIDESGKVRALDPQVPIPTGPALLTPLGVHRRVAEHSTSLAPRGDWHALVGALTGSPSWHDDPQAIQDRLRDDWR